MSIKRTRLMAFFSKHKQNDPNRVHRNLDKFYRMHRSNSKYNRSKCMIIENSRDLRKARIQASESGI